MEPRATRRRSMAGPVILIGLGVLFLMFNFFPDFDPWPVLSRYWPLFLIFLGLGRIWDYYRYRPASGAGPSAGLAAGAVPPAGSQPGAMAGMPPQGRSMSGVGMALLFLLVLLIAASWHARGRYDHQRFTGGTHNSQTIDLQGAKAVAVSLEVPAGQLRISGGSPHLVEADFHYGEREGQPDVNYSVSGDQGTLNITQESLHTHTAFGHTDNDWDLRFGNAAPLDLKLEMGAGQGDLSLRDLDVTNLDIEIGAGQLNLDLTGPHKSNLTGKIEGGAGQARIRLPKDTGVRIEASGGIGSIEAHGLQHDGDAYVNDAYGKTPTSIDLSVEGGVGEIDLIPEP